MTQNSETAGDAEQPLPPVLTQAPGHPVTAILALGSNLGDPPATLAVACQQVAALEGVSLTGESSRVVTAPVGGPAGQPDYLNQVLEISTIRSPYSLLEAVQGIELDHGRTREVRWQARTLDIDVITYGSVISSHPVLTLPHPRATQRGFVMIPWSWMDPGAFVGDVSVFRRARELEAEGGVRPFGGPDVDQRGDQKEDSRTTNGADQDEKEGS